MKGLHQWKFEDAWRTIYALSFNGKEDGLRRCYIGQTMNLRSRIRSHKREWESPFEVFRLGGVFGRYWPAADQEWAWRTSAILDGWEVYSAPGQPIDPTQHFSYTFPWVYDYLQMEQMVGLTKKGIDPIRIDF